MQNFLANRVTVLALRIQILRQAATWLRYNMPKRQS